MKRGGIAALWWLSVALAAACGRGADGAGAARPDGAAGAGAGRPDGADGAGAARPHDASAPGPSSGSAPGSSGHGASPARGEVTPGAGLPEVPAEAVGRDAAVLGAAVAVPAGPVAPEGDGSPIDLATYRARLLDLGSCAVTDDGIDPTCPALKALDEAVARGVDYGSDTDAGRASLARALIGHAAPAVRMKAAGLVRALLGTAKEPEGAGGTGAANPDEVILAAAQAEQHPAVLKALIGAVAHDGVRVPKVGELLLAASRHAAPTVRRAAVHALTSTWNRGLVGGPERLIAIMTSDADPGVRADACRYAGKLADERFIPTYTKLVQDLDSKLAGACLEGVIEMWWSFPFHENASEAAWKLTLAELGRRPRDRGRPAWQVGSRFEMRAEDTFAAWQKKARWYKPAELQGALLDIVQDRASHWMLRAGALRSLVAHGVTRAELAGLRKTYGADPEGPDAHVARALDEALARLP